MFLLEIDLPVACLENLAFSTRVKCEIVLHDRTDVDTTMFMFKSSSLILIMYILYKICILMKYVVNTKNLLGRMQPVAKSRISRFHLHLFSHLVTNCTLRKNNKVEI